MLLSVPSSSSLSSNLSSFLTRNWFLLQEIEFSIKQECRGKMTLKQDETFSLCNITLKTVDFYNTSLGDIDFTLTADIVDLTNYKDVNNVTSCRVWQLAQ